MKNQLFNKPLNQLTEEEKREIQQFWNKQKPSVAFSTAVIYLKDFKEKGNAYESKTVILGITTTL